LSDASFDVVAYGADASGVETGGVVEVVPGFVAFAGEDGAGVAAAHGDHDFGGADSFVGPGFGELVGDVDASFGQVDAWAGMGSGRGGGNLPSWFQMAAASWAS
jgi:hypothetical protein